MRQVADIHQVAIHLPRHRRLLFRALHRGKASVVDGGMNAFTARIAQRLPERLATAIAERAMRA